MISNFKYRLLTDWNIFRILRLGLAAIVLIQAWKNNDMLVGLVGGILLFQVVMNVGCCSSSACEINRPMAKNSVTIESIDKNESLP